MYVTKNLAPKIEVAGKDTHSFDGGICCGEHEEEATKPIVDQSRCQQKQHVAHHQQPNNHSQNIMDRFL